MAGVSMHARKSVSSARAGVLLAMVGLGALAASPPAHAAFGYEPAASNASIALNGAGVHGVAIDQATQRIYVAEITADIDTRAPGQVEQLESDGTPTAASPFVADPEASFSGVAVNPLTQDVYAAQFVIETPFGNFGASEIHLFSSAGTHGLEFGVPNTPGTAAQIATDATGRVYFPNDAQESVQVFNSSGALQETITCGGCPGGSFQRPVSVAVDGSNLYAVDIDLDVVVKFVRSGPNFVFDSILQSGRSAGAVGVDSTDGTVFVGALDPASGFHIVAYDSSGQQVDDFGAGLFGTPPFGIISAGQIAVNATTRKVYITDMSTDTLRVFERVTINAPIATANPASSVGQITARLNASVNPRFHALIDCFFEYTDHADFEANGYANATEVSCGSLPGGSTPTPINVTRSGLQPGTTYHYRVTAANNAGSTTSGSQVFTTLPNTPATVTTGTPTNVKQSSATLTGKVNPHGGTVTDCHFEYGIGLSYSDSVPCKSAVGPVTTDVSQTLEVTGLSSKTTYHYRLSVTSNAGTVLGNDQAFTTLPPAPTPVTETASNVTHAGATLRGSVDPDGVPTSCYFEYGKTTSYGATVACPTDPGEGEGPVAEQVALSGLLPATTYHYRLVGTNSGGTGKGLNVSFTTLSPPATPDPTPLPDPTPTPPPPTATPKPLKCKKGFRKKKVRGKLKCVKKKTPKRHRR